MLQFESYAVPRALSIQLFWTKNADVFFPILMLLLVIAHVFPKCVCVWGGGGLVSKEPLPCHNHTARHTIGMVKYTPSHNYRLSV